MVLLLFDSGIISLGATSLQWLRQVVIVLVGPPHVFDNSTWKTQAEYE